VSSLPATLTISFCKCYFCAKSCQNNVLLLQVHITSICSNVNIHWSCTETFDACSSNFQILPTPMPDTPPVKEFWKSVKNEQNYSSSLVYHFRDMVYFRPGPQTQSNAVSLCNLIWTASKAPVATVSILLHTASQAAAVCPTNIGSIDNNVRSKPTCRA